MSDLNLIRIAIALERIADSLDELKQDYADVNGVGRPLAGKSYEAAFAEFTSGGDGS